MKKVILLSTALFAFMSVNAQENIGQKIEELTLTWDREAEELGSYSALKEFCNNADYRGTIVGTLKGIHHYDSVLYDALSQKARYGGSKEITKTLKDIEKLEEESSIKDFLAYLNEECKAQYQIEKEGRKTGENMDSEIYLLETELQKYVKHITKRVDLVRDHVHHLNIR